MKERLQAPPGGRGLGRVRRHRLEAEGVRVGLGGIAHRPWRAWRAEEALRGAPATEESFRRAADAERRRPLAARQRLQGAVGPQPPGPYARRPGAGPAGSGAPMTAATTGVRPACDRGRAQPNRRPWQGHRSRPVRLRTARGAAHVPGRRAEHHRQGTHRVDRHQRCTGGAVTFLSPRTSSCSRRAVRGVDPAVSGRRFPRVRRYRAPCPPSRYGWRSRRNRATGPSARAAHTAGTRSDGAGRPAADGGRRSPRRRSH